MNRGYFGIGVVNVKFEVNIGTLYRSAYVYGADFIYTVGKRYKKQCSDTTKAFKHIPLFHFDDIDDLVEHLPYTCRLVGIELDDEAVILEKFNHPERCCYLLGAEDSGLPPKVINRCHELVKLPGKYCLNVSTAGSIVLYDRYVKGG